MVRMWFLGPPLVEHDGRPLILARRKALALLAYLAVTERRQSREALADLLYPRLDRTHTRSAFRNSLSQLRAAIGADTLLVEQGYVSLSEGADVDVLAFRRLASECRRADPSMGPGRVARLARAAGLYRGRFLEGFSLGDSPAFEHWQEEQAESLLRELSAVLESLVKVNDRPGRYEAAIEWAHALLALDPLEEGSHRRLMRLLALAGQRAAALRQFDHCKALLAEEGETPEEPTETLHEQIRRGELASQSPSRFTAGSRPETAVSRGVPPDEPPGILSAHPGILLLAQPRTESLHRGGSNGPLKRLAGMLGKAGGIVLTADGSEMVAAFASAGSAANAALTAMLGEAPSPGRKPGSLKGGTRARQGLALRCALHAGERSAKGDPSDGPVLNRAAHLLRAARPGQVLVSGAAARLLREELPKKTSLRSLGTHRLPDLGPPLFVYQLGHPRLRARFAALPTLDSFPNNLPTQPTPFIGREEELAAVIDCLGRDDVRLLTMTGPGGTGKTRLALQAAGAVAGAFTHGAFFMDLAALREPRQVVPSIAAALNVRELGADRRPLLESLAGYLRNRRVLLLLDNFEHLLPAAPDIAEILSMCPLVKVMATSREALHVRAERELSVPPLRLPSPGEQFTTLRRHDAVRFFCERASATDPEFAITEENAADVAAICARLDGLPLAIELAAAQVKARSPKELLERLGSPLELRMAGSRDLPARQQTLQREIDWSHDLLSESDKLLFRRLAPFIGGCTREAAEAVCCLENDGTRLDVAEGLSSLVEKSLLARADGEGEPRYRMLQVIRDHGLECLARSGEAVDVHGRLAGYFLDLAERAEPRLRGPEQGIWFDRLDAEHGNLLAALSWLHERGETLKGARLAAALGFYWSRQMRYSEGRHWLGLFHAAYREGDPPDLRAKLAFYLGMMLQGQTGPYMISLEAAPYFRESLGIWRKTENLDGIARSLYWLGYLESRSNPEAGGALLEESVRTARRTGDPWLLALSLRMAYSGLLSVRADLEIKEAALQEAISCARESGDPYVLARTFHGMGDVYLHGGDIASSEPWFRESIRVAREIGDKWTVFDGLFHLSTVYLTLGQPRKVKAVCREALPMAVDFGLRKYVSLFLEGMAGVAGQEGRPQRAARMNSAARDITANEDLELDQVVAYALSDED